MNISWNYTMCSSRKYPNSLHRRDLNFLGYGDSGKFQEMYEALREFPEGRGGVRKKTFCGGGMDIFWRYTILKKRYL